jgi:hypothetical protein
MTIDATQRFARLSAFVVVTLAAASACAMACSSTSSGGTTAQGDGGGASASASGQTCAWDEAKSRAAGLPIVSGAPGGYHVGDVLQSPDGCNGCGCTTQGFECTQNTCPPSRADAFDDSTCPADTSTCPDGTVMRRTTVACVFTRCPSAGSACTAELKNCPDGGTTGRSGPYCTYQYGSCN